MAAALFLLSLLATWGWRHRRKSDTTELMSQARSDFAGKDYLLAVRTSDRVLEREPANSRALLIAGDSAARLKQFRRAVRYYERLPDDGTKETVSGRLSLGLICRELGYLSRAEP